ncbi:alpha/beta-hydrolase [Aaosphaeria arxii CBS 175.79]|uniref:Alpha/beta-hydrolase n=1 Tax=Aaosphaeria arxii CBS 175.79 TaxID=1450172 RepID=A0A6A5Y2B8_9PLEO|nr:alpha/beta-hydrolase [Aaosphaeria arxii CBS 175.79]KAF2019187.1 alpha/beta-hydrolase [Aaosphaeria arxii CBS 175.79]
MTEIMEAFEAGLWKLPDMSGIIREEIKIPTRDGDSIRSVHYRPESQEPGPLILYFHGGGFVCGSPEQWDSHVAMLVRDLGAVVVSVDYRMAPEKTFPTAHHDGYDALKWAAENASTLKADLEKGFIVSGCSAGGSIASYISHQAVDDGLSPPLTGVILTVANLVHPDMMPEEYKAHCKSWEQNKDAMVLDQRGMRWFLSHYKPDPNSPLVNALNWPSGHQRQPPTYFQISGMDPIRDDSLIYESLLQNIGVPTRTTILKGLPHAAIDYFPMLSQVQNSVNELKQAVEWMVAEKAKQA